MSEPTDTQRLDKLGAYLGNPYNSLEPPRGNDRAWIFWRNGMVNGRISRIIDGQGPTLRDAIDSLPDEKGKL